MLKAEHPPKKPRSRIILASHCVVHRILRNSSSSAIGKAPASSSSLGLPCSWSTTLRAASSALSQVYTYRDLYMLTSADKGMLYLWPIETKYWCCEAIQMYVYVE